MLLSAWLLYSSALWKSAQGRDCASVTCVRAWLIWMAYIIAYIFYIYIATNMSEYCQYSNEYSRVASCDYSVMWWVWLMLWCYRLIIPINRQPPSPISVAYLIQIQIFVQIWNHHAGVSPDLRELRLPRWARNPFSLNENIRKQYW